MLNLQSELPARSLLLSAWTISLVPINSFLRAKETEEHTREAARASLTPSRLQKVESSPEADEDINAS